VRDTACLTPFILRIIYIDSHYIYLLVIYFFLKIWSAYFYIYQHKNIVFAYISAYIFQSIFIYLHVDIAFTYISAILPTRQPRWMSA